MLQIDFFRSPFFTSLLESQHLKFQYRFLSRFDDIASQYTHKEIWNLEGINTRDKVAGFENDIILGYWWI